MGGAGAVAGPASRAGAPPDGEPTGGRGCAAVHGAGGVSVAAPPTGVPTLDGGAVLLRQVDGGWHLGRGESAPGRAGAGAAGPRGPAQGGDHRTPEEQD